jgi:hypothetical protein
MLMNKGLWDLWGICGIVHIDAYQAKKLGYNQGKPSLPHSPPGPPAP